MNAHKKNRKQRRDIVRGSSRLVRLDYGFGKWRFGFLGEDRKEVL